MRHQAHPTKLPSFAIGSQFAHAMKESPYYHYSTPSVELHALAFNLAKDRFQYHTEEA